MSDWYVGRSKTLFGSSERAVSAIRDLGFDCFLPLRIESVAVRKRCHPVYINGKLQERSSVRPFLAGYWFVSFDVNRDPWGRILRLEEHRVKILGQDAIGRRPQKLPVGFVEALRDAATETVDDGNTVTKDVLPLGFGERSIDEMTPGTLGTILEGAFASFPATVECDMGDRIMIIAQIFGRDTRFPLPRAHFAPLSVSA